MEALKERETLSELVQKYDVHPQQITTWKAHFLAHAEGIFEKEGSATKEQDLDNEHQQFFGLWRAKIVGVHLWKTQVGSSNDKIYL